MKTYTRKDINVKTQLHDRKFIIVDHAVEMLERVAKMAVECGADEAKLVAMLTKDKEH